MTEDENKDIISINNNDIFNNINFDIDNIPWIISKYVFENNQEHGYKLHKGDIFKLGKYILRVREIGIDDDKKHFFFENKNTQKYIKNRSISNNNLSQMPLNQQENYFSALNLNQIINVERKDNNNYENRKENNDNNSQNNNNEEENGSNYNGGNIQIINNQSEYNNENNNNNSNNDNSNGNNNSNNNEINNNYNNFASIIHIKHKNNEDNENKSYDNNKLSLNNNQKVISIYYSNKSERNNSQSHKNNEIISNNGSNNNENDNGSHFLINIINNNSNVENNNILDDSKNKINNNSLGFHTFHNNSMIISSYNNSGKNISNFNNNSFKNNENEYSNNNSKMNLNLNLSNNNNNNNNNNFPVKSSFAALKSTASFKKKKLTDIQKKILKNTGSISEKNNKPICRICLSEEYEENNPLIHPCNCDGTMKYIHLQCLKLLIQSKIKKTETESCKVFTFKTLECEICKMVFPEKIRIKGSIYSIIDFEKPDKDYIILDGLIKETPEEKSIFIVHFKNKKEIKIGRATDANIRLSDISVSRAHAIISQYNDSFYLHDTNSKFGTLISAGNKFCILYNKPFSVQKGNILFEFLMKKTLCATLRCYRPSLVLYKTYNDFLDETFLNKYQFKEEELLIPEKTKTVSEYSSNAIIKPNYINAKSSKNIEFFDNEKNNNENNEFNNNIKKNNDSIQSKEDNKNSSSVSNSISNENKSKSKNSSNNNDDNINNHQNMFDSFKIDKEKENNNICNYQSIGVNKTQEISNIYQKNENFKTKNKNGISLDNNGNDSLLINNVNNISNDKS